MNDETDIELPQALIDRLAEQDRSAAMLTPRVDRGIAAAAEAQFRVRGGGVSREHIAVSAPEQRFGYLSRGAHRTALARKRAPAFGLAAAAAAAFVFFVVALREPGLARDFDGSGSIDVLDAFALSRELEQNPRFAATETVDSLMADIVALDGDVR